jgi:ElaB/YqjD/DUF883 family membrane-anchored ribosome-binding protein
MPKEKARARIRSDPGQAERRDSRATTLEKITMATSLLHPLRSKRNGALQDIEATVEDQVEALRDEIAALTKMIAKSNTTKKIKYQAQAGYDDLLGRSEDMLSDLQDLYNRGSREMRATVRRHPAATIGAAAAVGILIAFFARR